MKFPEIPAVDTEKRREALIRQNQLTKPEGSLGILENLSIDLAGMTGNIFPDLSQRAVFVFAADHGIASEGVSAYPPEVTPQMVLNFLNDGAAVNVVSDFTHTKVIVTDVGVNYDFHNCAGMNHRKIARGTANILHGPAMTREQAELAVSIGMEIAAAEAQNGLQLAAAGEVGIGNTTASAAITALLCSCPVREVTGRGTGLDDAGLEKKIAAIEQALAVNQPNRNDPMDILSKIGGFEIGAMAGAAIECASHRIPFVMDGLIATAAASLAVMMDPGVKDYLIAGHLSPEIGHIRLLKRLGKTPLLQLNMRVGEGSGAVLSFAVIDAAEKLIAQMATFESAHVADRKA